MRKSALVLASCVVWACACASSEDEAWRDAPVAAQRAVQWSAPEVLVKPSPFHGVHGLAIDAAGRLLAGTMVGSEMWQVDRQTGAARVYIPAPEGESDDIAVGPKGELAWTNVTQRTLRYRERDDAPSRIVASDLLSINSLAFDPQNGKLYASQVFRADALWEIDVRGALPPRLIAKDLGGLNGFEVGPDGWIYGPLWSKGQVVKIDPANGAITTLNAEFQTPAAANLDGRGNLLVVDAKTGELWRVWIATGARTLVAKLDTALDNLAVAPDGTIYVSNMADNSVQAVDPTSGQVKTLTHGELAVPSGLKFVDGTLYVADGFAFRAIDPGTGAVRDLRRVHGSELEYVNSVGYGGGVFALAAWLSGTVQVYDAQSHAHVATLRDFKTPMDAVPLDDDSLLVIEIGTGQLLRLYGQNYDQRVVVAKGLVGPTQLLRAKNGTLYLTESAGTLSKIDLATGAKLVLVDQLKSPEGLAETPWGSIVLAETGTRSLIEIDPASGARRTVATNLPIGLTPGRAGLPAPYYPTGVAVGDDGTVYVSADLDNSVLRIRATLPPEPDAGRPPTDVSGLDAGMPDASVPPARGPRDASMPPSTTSPRDAAPPATSSDAASLPPPSGARDAAAPRQPSGDPGDVSSATPSMPPAISTPSTGAPGATSAPRSTSPSREAGDVSSATPSTTPPATNNRADASVAPPSNRADASVAPPRNPNAPGNGRAPPPAN